MSIGCSRRGQFWWSFKQGEFDKVTIIHDTRSMRVAGHRYGYRFRNQHDRILRSIPQHAPETRFFGAYDEYMHQIIAFCEYGELSESSVVSILEITAMS